MVSDDIARTILAIQHALDYVIYGQGGAFDVTHEVTINRKNDVVQSQRKTMLSIISSIVIKTKWKLYIEGYCRLAVELRKKKKKKTNNSGFQSFQVSHLY